MTNDQRPTSPHLQIYRPQITSVTSITHRFTGLALAGGLLFLVYWLMAVADGPEAFTAAAQFFRSFIGRVVLLGVTFSFSYHLCNGIRHLVWDTGRGLELETARKSGYGVFGAAIVLTALFYIFAYGTFGGAA